MIRQIAVFYMYVYISFLQEYIVLYIFLRDACNNFFISMIWNLVIVPEKDILCEKKKRKEKTEKTFVATSCTVL